MTMTDGRCPFMDLSDAFTTSQVFPTRDILTSWARDIGKANGVIVIIIRSESSENGKGKKNKIVFGCDRHGRYSGVNVGCSSRHKTSKKCGRPFRLKAKPLDPPSLDWKVKVMCGIHNHEPLKTILKAAIFGKFNKKERLAVEEHMWLGVKAAKSLESIKRRFTNNLSNISQLYRTRNSLRKGKRGSRTEMQELLTLIQSHHYICWTRRLEGTDIVEEIMWSHPDSIKLLRMFPNVLIMDCTSFKINKYALPLLEIVGVTSTELTFSVAFAYLSHERYDDYTWVLQSLRDLMVLDIPLPQVILADCEEGLMNAIKVVFPEAVNLLCRYHINNNVNAKIKKAVKGDRVKSVMSLWHAIVDSVFEDEFYENLHDFEQSCADIPQLLKYVNKYWLYPHRERFCGPWMDKVKTMETPRLIGLSQPIGH